MGSLSTFLGLYKPTRRERGWHDAINANTDALDKVLGALWVNVKDPRYGATGDGVTDDTAAIVAAIAAVFAAGGGTVYFPVGTYKITSGLAVPSTVRLMGAMADSGGGTGTAGGAVISYALTTGNAITITRGAVSLTRVQLSDLVILGAASGWGNATTGLFLDGSTNFLARGLVENVRISRFGTGCKTANTLSVTFLDDYMHSNGTNLHFTAESNACTVQGGAYRDAVTNGIRIQDTSSTAILPGTVVESNGAVGLLIDGTLNNQSGIVIAGHYEANPRGIYINPSGSMTLLDSVINGALVTSAATAGIEVNNAALLRIRDIALPSASTILLNATTDKCTVSGVRGVVTDLGTNNSVTYRHGTNQAETHQGTFVHNGNTVMATAALATNATTGFVYIPTCAGTPTGVPTAFTGAVAMVFDTTNNRLYVYDAGWINIGTTT